MKLYSFLRHQVPTARMSAPERLMATIGKGLLAGLVGTAAITISQMIEMKLSKREPSTAPADAAGKVLGVKPRDEESKERFANVVHWAYGTSLGLLRAVLGGGRADRFWAPLVHLGAVQTAAMIMLPSLHVAPPVKDWEVATVGTEVLHHAVYAAATDATYRLLT
jgi:hypothetical protein